MKQINIGRAETNDIVITDDNTVSREHLQILIDDDALVFITDLNSSNGTFKNGKKIIGNHQILLNKQDIVKIGDTSLPWQDYVADYVKKANKDIQIKEKEVKDAYEKEGNKQNIPLKGNVRVKKYTWWKYDDEYITGWEYFVISAINMLLSLILVGLYLQSVNAYKRAKSLGNSSSTCDFFAIWGFLSIFIAFIPGVNLINVGLHWYLWFSNGPGKSY